jgi:hypothetical protein
VDFAEPGLQRRLEAYREVRGLSAVRQHLGWDEKAPLRRMAARPDFMRDPDWLKGLGMLEGLDLRCGLELFVAAITGPACRGPRSSRNRLHHSRDGLAD